MRRVKNVFCWIFFFPLLFRRRVVVMCVSIGSCAALSKKLLRCFRLTEIGVCVMCWGRWSIRRALQSECFRRGKKAKSSDPKKRIFGGKLFWWNFLDSLGLVRGRQWINWCYHACSLSLSFANFCNVIIFLLALSPSTLSQPSLCSTIFFLLVCLHDMEGKIKFLSVHAVERVFVYATKEKNGKLDRKQLKEKV